MKFSPLNTENYVLGAGSANGTDTERMYSFTEVDPSAGQYYLFEEALFGLLITGLQQKPMSSSDLRFLFQDGLSLEAKNQGDQIYGAQKQSTELSSVIRENLMRENFFVSDSDLSTMFEHALSHEDFKKQLSEVLNHMKETGEGTLNNLDSNKLDLDIRKPTSEDRWDKLNQFNEVAKSGLAHLEEPIETVKKLENSNTSNLTRVNKGQNTDLGGQFGDAKFSEKNSTSIYDLKVDKVKEIFDLNFNTQASEVHVPEKPNKPVRLSSSSHLNEVYLAYQRGTRELSFGENVTLIYNPKLTKFEEDKSFSINQSKFVDNTDFEEKSSSINQSKLADKTEAMDLFSTSDADQKGEGNFLPEQNNQNNIAMNIKDFRQEEVAPVFELVETLISAKDNVYATIRKTLEQFVGSNGFSVRVSMDSDLVRSVVVQFDRGKVRAIVHSRNDRLRKLIVDTSDELKESLRNKGYELVELRFVDALSEDMKNFPVVESVQILQQKSGGR